MTPCQRCKLRYPDGLVTQMFVSIGGGNRNGGKSGYLNLCGICALEVSNNVNGTNRVSFQGEQAEQMRQDALAWRARHPDEKPVKGNW